MVSFRTLANSRELPLLALPRLVFSDMVFILTSEYTQDLYEGESWASRTLHHVEF
jgi:hypothetical protein